MASLMVTGGYYYWNYVRESETTFKRRVASALECATVPDPTICAYRPRPALAAALNDAMDVEPFNFTLLVTGPRGAGKSVLLQKVMQDKACVVHLELVPGTIVTDAQLVEALLTELNINYTGLGLRTTPLVMKLLASRPVPPRLLVEVNARCTSAEVQSLLLRLKVWGADKHLVRPVVVLSTTRAACGLTIDMDSLRTTLFTVPDMTESEATLLLKSLLQDKPLACTEAELTRICTRVVSVLGTRPLHLTLLVNAMTRRTKNIPTPLSCAALEDLLIQLIQERRSQLWQALSTCQTVIAGTDPNKCQAFRTFVTAVKKAPVALATVPSMLGITREHFLTILSELQPHPFYVAMTQEPHVHLGTPLVHYLDETQVGRTPNPQPPNLPEKPV